MADVDTGLTYGSAEPVVVRVRQQGAKAVVDVAGAAVRLAQRPAGWFDRSERVVRRVGLNVNRRGVVYVPAVGTEGQDRLVELVATASLEVYDALVDDA